jgi:hypothetical protein
MTSIAKRRRALKHRPTPSQLRWIEDERFYGRERWSKMDHRLLLKPIDPAYHSVKLHMSFNVLLDPRDTSEADAAARVDKGRFIAC